MNETRVSPSSLKTGDLFKFVDEESNPMVVRSVREHSDGCRLFYKNDAGFETSSYIDSGEELILVFRALNFKFNEEDNDWTITKDFSQVGYITKDSLSHHWFLNNPRGNDLYLEHLKQIAAKIEELNAKEIK